MKLEGYRQCFEKYSNIKFHETSYSETDGHEANSRFSQFAKAPKKLNFTFKTHFINANDTQATHTAEKIKTSG
jgi:hypothetical protein